MNVNWITTFLTFVYNVRMAPFVYNSVKHFKHVKKVNIFFRSLFVLLTVKTNNKSHQNVEGMNMLSHSNMSKVTRLNLYI